MRKKYLILTVVFCVLCFNFLHYLIRYIVHRRRRRRQQTLDILHILMQELEDEIQHRENPRGPLDPSIIGSLPRFEYLRTGNSNGKSSSSPAPECSVCLSAVEEGEEVRVLPNCMHMFHVDCIDKWLHSNSTCPVCRTRAEPAPVPVSEDRSEETWMPELQEEMVEGGRISEAETATSLSKERSLASSLGSSFRRIISRGGSMSSSSGAVHDEGALELEDLERQ